MAARYWTARTWPEFYWASRYWVGGFEPPPPEREPVSARDVLIQTMEELGLESNNVNVSDSDRSIRSIVAMINAAGRDLARRAEWSRLYRVTTIAGNSTVAQLPADFFKMAEGGAIALNRQTYNPVRTIVAPVQWKFAQSESRHQHYFHLNHGELYFTPALPAEGAVMRYVSRHWVVDKDHVEEDGDELRVPDTLVARGAIYRWLRQKGMPYEDMAAEYEAQLLNEIQADRGED